MNETTVQTASSAGPDLRQERARRRRVDRRSEIAVVVANGVGALLAQAYLFVEGGAEFLDPAPVAPAETVQGAVPTFTVVIVVSVALVGCLIVLGHMLGNRQGKEMKDWYLHPGERPSIPSPTIQRQALENPIQAALISLTMWALAGIIAGASVGIRLSPSLMVNPGIVLSHALVLAGLPGGIAATLVYFITERIWQPEIHTFFPEGKIREAHAFRMTVRRRILVLFVIQAMTLLVLAAATYRQADRIARAEDPMALLSQFLRLEAFVIGVGMLAALTLASTLGRYLISGVEALQSSMALVRHGDLRATLPVTSNDEFGELAEGFNAMVAGLQQEEVVRRLFSLYVTPEVAEHAIEHGAALGGRLTHATVLFSDIRGFTSLTEQSEPGALIALLNRYFQAMSSVITHHGGFVNKFGGDSLLAVFGTPLNPTPDHADRAVIAAREMLTALRTFNADQAVRGEPSLRCGIGIATGAIIAGNVGSRERLEYTVIGDTVNLASRLQTMTKAHETDVLISGSTASALTDTQGLLPMGTIAVRGKQEPAPIFGFPLPTAPE